MEGTGGASLDSVVSQISRAAKEWGFFQVINHNVPARSISDFDLATEKFFSMGKDVYKYKIKRNADNSRGYFDDELTKQTLDWKECVDIGAQEGDLDGVSDVDGWNQWPGDLIPSSELPQNTHEHIRFKSSMIRYFHDVAVLSRKLLGALALGMGKDETFFHHL